MATTSSDPERISRSAISSACSPWSGWETSSSSDVHTDPLGVARVHGVLGVDEGRQPAVLLGLRDEVIEQRRLTGALRAEDLDDASARESADAEGDVQRQGPARNDAGIDFEVRVAHPHDRALAELALDLGEGGIEGFFLLHGDTPGRDSTEEPVR